MISDNLQKNIIEAMKAKDTLRVSTLRMLHSELKNAQIDKGGDLNEEDELKVVKSEAKKRRDSIEAYEKGGNQELAESEKKELAILEEFLPEQMSDKDLEKIVDEVVAETGAKALSDMGPTIGKVMAKVGDSVDGKRVSMAVKAKLS